MSRISDWINKLFQDEPPPKIPVYRFGDLEEAELNILLVALSRLIDDQSRLDSGTIDSYKEGYKITAKLWLEVDQTRSQLIRDASSFDWRNK